MERKPALINLRLLARHSDHAIAEEVGPDITPLHKAAFEGSIKRVKALLASGAHVNATDRFDWTQLHDAVIQGHVEIVTMLIAAGANVNAQDNEERYTPLHEAARMRYPEIKKYFLPQELMSRSKTVVTGLRVILSEKLRHSRLSAIWGGRKLEATCLHRYKALGRLMCCANTTSL